MQNRRQSKGLDESAQFRVRKSRAKSLSPTLHTSAIVGPLPLGLVQSRLKTRRHECVRRIRARQKDVELAKSGQAGVGQGFVRRHCFFGFRRGLGNGVGHS
jgi:hypothetical protein